MEVRAHSGRTQRAATARKDAWMDDVGLVMTMPLAAIQAMEVYRAHLYAC